MNRETLDVLADVEQAIEHRIKAHRAALVAAEALGWPAILGPAVADTEARLEEAKACLECLHLAGAA